jgi:hypothetical protein
MTPNAPEATAEAPFPRGAGRSLMCSGRACREQSGTPATPSGRAELAHERERRRLRRWVAQSRGGARAGQERGLNVTAGATLTSASALIRSDDVSGGEQRGPLSGGVAHPSAKTRPAAMSSPAVSPWTLNAWESFPPLVRTISASHRIAADRGGTRRPGARRRSSTPSPLGLSHQRASDAADQRTRRICVALAAA